MNALVNIDGRLVRPEDARVSVFDRGFLFGDSVYETLRTYHGVPFLLDRHLARLGRSASRLALPLPDLAHIATEAMRTHRESHHAESSLRIIVTRGSEPGVVNLDPTSARSAPTLVVIAREFAGFPAEFYSRGVSVAIAGVQRNPKQSLDPAIKSGNYLNNVMAMLTPNRGDAFECLMTDRDGRLTEATTANVWIVKGGVVRTPAFEVGLLDGITRGFLFEIGRGAGIEMCEAPLQPSDLFDADEAFLSASLKEVLPVVAADGRTIGSGAPGPITRRLHALYRAAIERLTTGARDADRPTR